jgi:hypothetical protein
MRVGRVAALRRFYGRSVRTPTGHRYPVPSRPQTRCNVPYEGTMLRSRFRVRVRVQGRSLMPTFRQCQDPSLEHDYTPGKCRVSRSEPVRTRTTRMFGKTTDDRGLRTDGLV